MVGARGFEPPASWSRTRRATRLRYAPRDAKLTSLYRVVKEVLKFRTKLASILIYLMQYRN